MPFMGRVHPSLIRFPKADMRYDDIPHIADKSQRFKHQELMKERFRLIKEISKSERLIDAHSGDQRKYYEESRKKSLAKLSDLEADIAQIERGMPETLEPVNEPEIEDVDSDD
jgi:hypothetical protein